MDLINVVCPLLRPLLRPFYAPFYALRPFSFYAPFTPLLRPFTTSFYDLFYALLRPPIGDTICSHGCESSHRLSANGFVDQYGSLLGHPVLGRPKGPKGDRRD
jgi:hypothetical protein